MKPLQELSIQELQNILLTCDGFGKDIKKQALEILLLKVNIIVVDYNQSIKDNLPKIIIKEYNPVYIEIDKQKEPWRRGRPLK